ncbi:PASTA domain-containing protein [Ferruginibacter sp. SUN002]|uniref:PASTA domain-containing protein n=1 Tax=Ferruginibacter sp. SUN002 TaxID=2937789 RepID=UPI003D35CED7
MFKFITDRPLWVNLLAALVLGLLLVFLTLQTLSWLTNHGQYLTVPSLVGKDTKEAIKILEEKGFEVVIQDSVYTDTLKKGTVIKQLPDGNATVKVNRSVFLTVNRYTPPMIEMPKLEGLSLRFALDVLARSHLKLQDTIYKQDFMKGSILEQQYMGSKIMPGQKIQWGSAITLIVSGGLPDEQILVPDLYGMRFLDAKALLDSNGLSLGAVIATGDVRDTGSAFIYGQSPRHLDEKNTPYFIHPGQLMDIWISSTQLPRDTIR